MVTFLITSLFILVLLAVAVYFWQKPASPAETDFLPLEPERRGLFAGDLSKDAPTFEDTTRWEAQRAEILARAQAGEKSALNDASCFSESLYDDVLNSLVAAAEGPQLLSLVSYVSRHELPVNNKLAVQFMQAWKNAPTRNSTAEMLHLAALSNDAKTYEVAVEAALQCWRQGTLADVSAQELKSVIDGEFWILSTAERSSGAGFLLKQTLANARSELDLAAKYKQHS